VSDRVPQDSVPPRAGLREGKAGRFLFPGLVSITFRSLAPRDIVALAAQAGLVGVEWGGDIHVPHGDLARAGEVGRMTRDAGLAVASYGSYYVAGPCEAKRQDFRAVLDTALELGAPNIRVWAGDRGSAAADDAYRRRVEEDAIRIAGLADGRGVTVAFEFHGGTLTDTTVSASTLLTATAAAGFRGYWQPPIGWSISACAESLSAMLPRLANLHVYQWGGQGDRLPLAEGEDRWRSYLQLARTAPTGGGRSRWALLEFVRNDDPAQLAADARVLVRLLERIASKGVIRP